MTKTWKKNVNFTPASYITGKKGCPLMKFENTVL